METNKINEQVVISEVIAEAAEEAKAKSDKFRTELEINMHEELQKFDEEMSEIDEILGTNKDLIEALNSGFQAA